LNILNIFSRFTRNPVADRRTATNERLQQYARFLRAYQGYSVRGVLNTNLIKDWKRVKFNFTQPIVNLSAGWFAAKPLVWEIANEPEATAEAHAIWARSGSDAALLENAICCGIYGDLVGLATQDDAGKAKIEFVDPSIATPTFQGSDYSQLSALEIACEQVEDDGRFSVRREMWMPQGMEAYEDDKLVDSRSYDVLPACWIKNSSIKGAPFGMSDVEPILELVEEYDHLAAKQTRIVDYYASPSLVFKGVQAAPSGTVQKNIGTVYYLSPDGDAKFLEWSGNTPDVGAQLTTIRDAIAEISQVPKVAFGQADSGITSISGVAIQILYGPLLSKTHRKQAQWGHPLQFLMWQCLLASGYKSLPFEAVSVGFPSATPVDGQSTMAEMTARIAARVSSRRTAMTGLGIEKPEQELLRIIFEEKALQLTTPAPAIEMDANIAAKAGARGMFAAETPNGVGANKGAPGGGDAPEQPTVGDTTSTNDDDIAHLMQRFDAIMEAEQKALDEQNAPQDAA
jgi:hypothetical protein